MTKLSPFDPQADLNYMIQIGLEHGRTVNAIASILGVTYHTVYMRAKRRGLPFSSKTLLQRSAHQESPFTLARVAKGWTQFEAAQRIGVCSQTIRAWERGYHTPQPFLAQCAAEAYGVTLGWLLGEDIIGKEA